MGCRQPSTLLHIENTVTTSPIDTARIEVALTGGRHLLEILELVARKKFSLIMS